jgi:hypothetical protein
MKQDKERMSQIIEINNSMQQKLYNIDNLLQTVENEVDPSFHLPTDTSVISQVTNNVLKRARSGEYHERWIPEVKVAPNSHRSTDHSNWIELQKQKKGKAVIKSSRSNHSRKPAAEVFISTEVGQVIKINNNNG